MTPPSIGLLLHLGALVSAGAPGAAVSLFSRGGSRAPAPRAPRSSYGEMLVARRDRNEFESGLASPDFFQIGQTFFEHF